jgi:thiol-disulfide isomerase/thioredoxin
MSGKKDRAAIVLVALAVAFAAPALRARALEIGDAMPMADAKLKSVAGGELSLGAASGAKGTLVLFTCNTCPWVKAWEERIVALGNEYAKKGVGVVAVNANDPAVFKEEGFEAMQKRARERGYQFPYVVDDGSRLAHAFDATRTPEAFLFDAGGRLVYHGSIDDNAQSPDEVKEHYLRDALQSLLDGKKVALAVTKSLGCTIKFYK